MNLAVRSRLTIVCVLSMAGTVLPAQTPGASHACTPARWSTPQLLEKRREDAFEVTSAVAATTRAGDIFVAGRGPDIWTDTSVYLKVPFVAYRIDRHGKSTPLPAPAYYGDYAYPRLAVGNDTVHVFWGERDSAATWPKPRAIYPAVTSLRSSSSVWTSAYTGTWSTPRRVAAYTVASWVLLQPWTNGPRSRTAQVPVIGDPVGNTWYLQWVGESASSDLPDLLLGGIDHLYPTVVLTAPRQLVLGYIINYTTDSLRYRNGVYAARSTDDGRALSAPVRIAPAGPGSARDVTITQTPDGLLHAVWGVSNEHTGLDAQRIGYAVSRDTAKSWTTATYLDAPQSIYHLQVVGDRYNRIHMVLQDLLPGADASTPALFYTTRSASSDWSKPTLLFGDTLSARAPVLTATDSGDPVLLLSQRLGMRGKFPWFASAISYLHPGRDCMPKPYHRRRTAGRLTHR
jgi:hypothetical protein